MRCIFIYMIVIILFRFELVWLDVNSKILVVKAVKDIAFIKTLNSNFRCLNFCNYII